MRTTSVTSASPAWAVGDKQLALIKGRTIMFLTGRGAGGWKIFTCKLFFFKRLLLQTIFNGPSLSYLGYMYFPSPRLLHLVPQRHQPKYYLRRPSTFNVPINVPICSTNLFRQSFLPSSMTGAEYESYDMLMMFNL